MKKNVVRLFIGIIFVWSLGHRIISAQEKMNLSDVRKEIAEHIESLQVAGKPTGCYRLKQGGEAELYATCDVAIMRTIMDEDQKKSLKLEQHRQWIGYINSFPT